MEREDRARIHLKLDEMMQYIEELKEMLPDEEEYLHDLKSRRACEKTIEVAIESVIDVCAMIVSSERLGMPSNEESIIDILVEKNVLDMEFGERLKDMKGFRNILIHRYAHVDDGIVYSNLTDYLDDFGKFNRIIQSYMERFVI
ncbi:MAG: DUF86 domain-containing protein [Euryarchaeota archaeon]|nr:DUF86 domain-containing protein [Euryarchaeota archaeon]MBU4221045.1 DUF86 domain-containing protein [Euryarchaeota archaeon]MCG2735541.1 DUF86 domain-containing protein [Candidatus Methanoperedenaceae archaeon]